jgi:uncharacterized damage-inducible protein DinB
MLEMIRLLFQHQAWADAAVFKAMHAHENAVEDEKLRAALHHIVLVQRFFLALFLKRPFDIPKEQQAPGALADLERLFREAQMEELAYVQKLGETELARIVDMPWIEGSRLTLAQALMQVIMHSQSHRGQCLSRLRAIGGQPPTLDFILWLKDRPAPNWP